MDSHRSTVPETCDGSSGMYIQRRGGAVSRRRGRGGRKKKKLIPLLHRYYAPLGLRKKRKDPRVAGSDDWSVFIRPHITPEQHSSKPPVLPRVRLSVPRATQPLLTAPPSPESLGVYFWFFCKGFGDNSPALSPRWGSVRQPSTRPQAPSRRSYRFYPRRKACTCA